MAIAKTLLKKTLKLTPEQIVLAIGLLTEEERAFLEILSNKEFMSLGAKDENDFEQGLPKKFVKELKKARKGKFYPFFSA